MLSRWLRVAPSSRRLPFLLCCAAFRDVHSPTPGLPIFFTVLFVVPRSCFSLSSCFSLRSVVSSPLPRTLSPLRLFRSFELLAFLTSGVEAVRKAGLFRVVGQLEVSLRVAAWSASRGARA